MSDPVVQRVSSPRQRRDFLKLPWTLYRGDPHWIPPLRLNQKEMVNYISHPFYERNAIQTFIAYRDGNPCGRIAAILNHGHNLRHHEKRGFFGFFEAVDDQAVAHALFGAARQWFADQGIYRLRGPCNPSLNYEVGLLVEGFDSSPTFMMTYNPPYYERLMTSYGFRKSQDLYAFHGHIDMLPKVREKLLPVVEQIIERYNVRLRPLDRKNFFQDVMQFLRIYNRALTNTWGFVPMSEDEVRHMAKGLQMLLIQELAVGAEVDGQMIGVSLTLPDYNPRIKAIDGRLFPFGFLRLLRNKQAIKRVRVISTNVLPEYQRLGMGLLLMHALATQSAHYHFEEAEFSWVLESNLLSRGSLEKGGAKRTKTYRLYDLDDDPPATANGTPAPHRRAIIAVAAPPAGPLEVREVHGGADHRAFVDLPWRIYADDPQWVPPLKYDVEHFLSPRRPFYEQGAATKFLALRGGVPVGRILASDDARYRAQSGENVGCFGMFECQDDRQAAHALLDAAGRWLAERGRARVRGPIDYSMNYQVGLLVDGFDTPPRVMMNHHRIWYADLIESWGLKKVKDLYAWWFTDPLDLVAKWRERVERIARRTGIALRPFNGRDLKGEAQRCRQLYSSTWRASWAFTEPCDREFDELVHRISYFAKDEQVLFAEKDGATVGMCVTLPDINEAIRPLDGRLTTWGLPLGALRLARGLKRIRTARLAILAIDERFRRRGVAELLILRTLDYGKHVLGYTGAELSWTLEDNSSILPIMETVGATRYKTYRIYEREL